MKNYHGLFITLVSIIISFIFYQYLIYDNLKDIISRKNILNDSVVYSLIFGLFLSFLMMIIITIYKEDYSNKHGN